MWRYKRRIIWFLPCVSVIVAVSFIGSDLTAFMKKRTHQCVEWMGYLGTSWFYWNCGIRPNEGIGEDHLQTCFYHILPYSMVFGLFDLYAKKLDALKLLRQTGMSMAVIYFDIIWWGTIWIMWSLSNLTVVEPSESEELENSFLEMERDFRRRLQAEEAAVGRPLYKLSGDTLSLGFARMDTKSDCG